MMTGAESVLTNIIISLVCNVMTEGSFRAFDQQREALRRQIQAAAESGRLPVNHDLERAVARAHLRACDALLNRVAQNSLTDRPTAPGTYVASWIHPNFTCLSKVRRWLLSGIAELDHLKPVTLSRQERAAAVLTAFSDTVRSLSDGAVKRLANDLTDAPEASRAAAIQVARIGGWPGGHPAPGALEEVFLLEPQGWATAFSLCFIEELKQDTRLDRVVLHIRLAEVQVGLSHVEQRILDQLNALSESSSELVDDARALLRGEADKMAEAMAAQIGAFASEILGALGVVEERLRAVQDELAALKRLLSWEGHFLFRKQDDATKPSDKEIGVFHFSARFDDFIGRNAEFDTVRTALIENDAAAGSFRWMLIYGDAGTGKSRFAQELIDRVDGAWAAGFVSPQAITTANFSRMIDVSGPILMVVDYGVSFRDSFPDFVAGWADRAELLNHPVRMLILVRRESDPMILSMCDNRPEHLGGIIEKCEAKPRIALARLETEELVLTLMRGRLSKTAAIFGEKAKLVSDAHLLRALDKFDPSRRPLFAAMVAHAIQRDMLPKVDETEDDGEQARIQLFTQHLREQRTKRWRGVAEQEMARDARAAANLRRRHETIAMLATILRGLRRDQFERLVTGRGKESAIAREMLVCKSGSENRLFNQELLRSILEAPVNDVFPALQPDLIGEWFVLGALLEASPDADDDEREYHAKRRAWLLRAAWRIDPESTAEFTRLAHQDYRKTVGGLNWLRDPRTGAA